MHSQRGEDCYDNHDSTNGQDCTPITVPTAVTKLLLQVNGLESLDG